MTVETVDSRQIHRPGRRARPGRFALVRRPATEVVPADARDPVGTEVVPADARGPVAPPAGLAKIAAGCGVRPIVIGGSAR